MFLIEQLSFFVLSIFYGVKSSIFFNYLFYSFTSSYNVFCSPFNKSNFVSPENIIYKVKILLIKI